MLRLRLLLPLAALYVITACSNTRQSEDVAHVVGEPPSSAQEASAQAVNETMTRSADFTGDGIPEKLVVNFQGKSWRDPFKWSLTVYDQGKVILEHKSDDTWLDEHYADTNYVGGCADYLSCKKSYYERLIVSRLTSVTDSAADWGVYDQQSGGSVYFVGKEDLIKKYQLPEQQAAEIIDSIVGRMRTGKVVLLNVPVSAVQDNAPLMYVREVNGFVRVYEP